MEENLNISEKLLRTNLMELLGGKGMDMTHELLKQEIIVPPEPPLNIGKSGGNDGNNGRMPELRSSEVNEVLSKPPTWLIRWGITIFFFVLLLMLAVTWFVRYPDLVRGNLKIVSQNLPKSVIAKTDGKLVKLLATDGQIVQQGQKIAYLESTANHDEVMILNDLTDSLVNMTSKDNLSAAYTVEIPTFSIG